MVYNEDIKGKYITLNSVREKDAADILKLRLDETKNKYINAVENDIEKEIEWIRKQNKAIGDYFFNIVRNSDNSFLGNISIYNVDTEHGLAELGRWVSRGASIENIESILLAHNFAFDILKLDAVYTKTLQDNKQVVSLWKRFGGQGQDNKIIEDRIYYYNIIYKETYIKNIKNRFINFFGESMNENN